MPTPQLLSPEKQLQWLVQHIPHRVRAALPGLPMTGGWLLPTAILAPHSNPISIRFVGNSIHEGRLTAMRWLIEFVGVQQDKGIPIETRLRFPTDMRIDAISGRAVFTSSRPEAVKLALVWKGCSQATSHPTTDTNHPKVDEPELAEALAIVVDYLEETIYQTAKRRLFDEVMRVHGP